MAQQGDANLKFLKVNWPNIKRQMEIIFEQYNVVDDDGVIRCYQQNSHAGCEYLYWFILGYRPEGKSPNGKMDGR